MQSLTLQALLRKETEKKEKAERPQCETSASKACRVEEYLKLGGERERERGAGIFKPFRFQDLAACVRKIRFRKEGSILNV